MGLAEGVATRNQSNRLFVVHRHATEGLANIPGRGDRIRLAVRAFRIHVNKSHLHGGQRIGELSLSGIARLRTQPLFLRAPIHVMVRLPYVLPAASKTEGFEAHRFERHITGKNHQVGPGNLAAKLLFDWPEQPSRLVETRVVRPTIEWRKALLASAAAAAAVTGTVCTGAV